MSPELPPCAHCGQRVKTQRNDALGRLIVFVKTAPGDHRCCDRCWGDLHMRELQRMERAAASERTPDDIDNGLGIARGERRKAEREEG